MLSGRYFWDTGLGAILAGEGPPDIMDGRSLLPIMLSDKSGHIENGRDYVITGRERHTSMAREGKLPYPQRAIRTKDYLYIVNFEPGRWPMGDPRVTETPCRFESQPYAGGLQDF